MSKKMPKIAVVGPNFFSYMHAIRDQFRSLGIESEYFDERHSNSIPAKICYRLNISLLIGNKRQEHLNKLMNSIFDGVFTDVLLIDVEVVDKSFIQSLKERGIRVHIYMWDSAKNKSGFTNYLSEVSGKGTFDLNDSKQFDMKYIPLFATDNYSQKKNQVLSRDIDISFCGTLHSDRAYHLHRLSKVAEKKGLKLVLMNFFHSKLLLAIKCFRHSSNAYFLKTVSTDGFAKEYVAESMFRSKFVFDMQHAGQGGLTARTFEALRSGACLITFNEHVYSRPETFHNRIFLIKDANDILNLKLSDYENVGLLSESQDHYLSLSRFVGELLVIMGYSFEQECEPKKYI
jgi:hypothetical protein